jgi:hypothetical protein
MGTNLDVVIMLGALLTMLGALVWWDGPLHGEDRRPPATDPRRHQ